MDYDPSVISYEDLVNLFFEDHDETLRPFAVRVKSILFYRDSGEEEVARSVLEDVREQANGKGVFTEIKAYDEFYLAESRHQLSALKKEVSLYEELMAMYGSEESIAYSVLASKLNAYIVGYGTDESLEELLELSALSEASKERLREVVINR